MCGSWRVALFSSWAPEDRGRGGLSSGVGLGHRWSLLINLKARTHFPSRLWADPRCLQTAFCAQLGWRWGDMAHLAVAISMLGRFGAEMATSGDGCLCECKGL